VTHPRRLVAIGVALVLVLAMVVGDVVVLHRARPSLVNETRNFDHLIASQSTTTTSTTTTIVP
jgi:hypothetical protein